MNIEDAIKALDSGGSVKMMVPSFKYAPLFKPMNTGIQKTLGRISLNSDNLYHAGMMRLALFDELLLENKHEYKASLLKVVDMVAFHAQLKMQTSKTIDMVFTCGKCGTTTNVKVDLEKILKNCCSYTFRKFSIKVSGGSPSHDYEFVICEPSYMDTLILAESVRKSQDVLSETLNEAEFYYAYSKLCLYISEVKLDGNLITNNDNRPFNMIPVQDRLKFFDSIDQRITISEDNPDSLLNFISKNFSEEDISGSLFNGTYSPDVCSNKECGQKMENVITYDTFFTV